MDYEALISRRALTFLLLASSLRDERSGFFFALTPRFSGLYQCTASVCHAHARGETISLLIASPIISVSPSPPLPRRSLNLLPTRRRRRRRRRGFSFPLSPPLQKPIAVAAGGFPSEFPGGEKGKKPTSHLTPSFPQQGKEKERKVNSLDSLICGSVVVVVREGF